MRVKTISLSDITVNDEIQQRAGGINNSVVDEYRQEWDAGADFPAVDVFDDGDSKWLAGGFHRVISARHAGKETIKAHVHHGTRKDATVFACGENGTHGYRRTNADKRKAVKTLIGLFANRSNRWIAEKAAVHHDLVTSVKTQLADSASCHIGQINGQPSSTVGRDGKKRRTKRKPQTPTVSPPSEDERKQHEIKMVCSYLMFPAGIHDGMLSEYSYSFKRMAKPWSDDDRTLVRNYLSEGVKLLTKWLKELESLKSRRAHKKPGSGEAESCILKFTNKKSPI